MIPQRTFEIVSQSSHVCFGALISLLVCGCTRTRRRCLFYMTLLIGLAAGKEWWYDNRFETPAVRGSNLLDFSTYCAGLVLGYICFLLLQKAWSLPEDSSAVEDEERGNAS